jgi:hypothetical protein
LFSSFFLSMTVTASGAEKSGVDVRVALTVTEGRRTFAESVESAGAD